MIQHPTTWGQVWPSGYVKDRNGETWKLMDEKDGFVLLQNRTGEQRSMLRPSPDTPVTAVVYTEQEAISMMLSVFPGAQVIAQQEGLIT